MTQSNIIIRGFCLIFIGYGTKLLPDQKEGSRG